MKRLMWIKTAAVLMLLFLGARAHSYPGFYEFDLVDSINYQVSSLLLPIDRSIFKERLGLDIKDCELRVTDSKNKRERYKRKGLVACMFEQMLQMGSSNNKSFTIHAWGSFVNDPTSLVRHLTIKWQPKNVPEYTFWDAMFTGRYAYRVAKALQKWEETDLDIVFSTPLPVKYLIPQGAAETGVSIYSLFTDSESHDFNIKRILVTLRVSLPDTPNVSLCAEHEAISVENRRLCGEIVVFESDDPNVAIHIKGQMAKILDERRYRQVPTSVKLMARVRDLSVFPFLYTFPTTDELREHFRAYHVDFEVNGGALRDETLQGLPR